MKLSSKTVSILKHMASINPSINIKEGSILRTISSAKDVMMRVEVQENFGKGMVIFDLPQFISTLDLFENPVLELDEKYVTIKEDGKDNTSVRYVYADESVCPAQEKDIPLPSEDIKFKITAKDVQTMLKSAAVLGVPDITVKGDGKEMTMLVHNKAVDSSSNYAIQLGETDGTFNVDFKAEKLKLIPDDYNVTISNKKISQFVAVNSDVTYWVGVEFTSKFE
jgi:hypothetical protein